MEVVDSGSNWMPGKSFRSTASTSAVVFDREGRVQFALNEKGDGPGQYLNLSDFAIDTVRRNLVVLCAVSNALFFYDLGGKFIDYLIS